MSAGNEARMKANDNSILALGAATRIHRLRRTDANNQPSPRPKTAYIVRSLKRPEEVHRLRAIYGPGFYLVATHAEHDQRFRHLVNYFHMTEEQARTLIERDADETGPHGQQVTKTFQLADFFIRVDSDDVMNLEVDRIARIIFSDPFATPSFDEFAMFMAFAGSLRSADLSRQVGAVIARDHQILAHGANDCPSFDGGLYWPRQTKDGLADEVNGRDYMREITDENGNRHRGYDSNAIEQKRIAEKIVEAGKDKGLDEGILRDVLANSPIADITEYGRVVHAEMEALLSCARERIGTRGATLYSTTFPCHNCAKHIVAAGIHRVVYIEPYPKSKALEFHDDSICLGFQKQDKKVHFEPFVGVGPRRFFDLFSYRHGSGRNVQRKTNGLANQFNEKAASLRLQMLPFSYLDLEEIALDRVAQIELNQE